MVAKAKARAKVFEESESGYGSLFQRKKKPDLVSSQI